MPAASEARERKRRRPTKGFMSWIPMTITPEVRRWAISDTEYTIRREAGQQTAGSLGRRPAVALYASKWMAFALAGSANARQPAVNGRWYRQRWK
jgi:hypothetical protein